jgi:hypothetical protein
MKRTSISLLAAAAVMASGCATIVNGSTERVEITSDPPGATAKVDGIPIGTTPTSIDLKRGEPHSVTIEKDGYVSDEESIGQGTSGWIAGNILVGGLVGLIVDYSTGAAHTLKPESVSPVLMASAPPHTGAVPLAQGAPAAGTQAAATLQPAAASDAPTASRPVSDATKGAPSPAPAATNM